VNALVSGFGAYAELTPDDTIKLDFDGEVVVAFVFLEHVVCIGQVMSPFVHDFPAHELNDVVRAVVFEQLFFVEFLVACGVAIGG